MQHKPENTNLRSGPNNGGWSGAYYYVATRDIFAASRFLGHSSVTITESHYVGLIQSLQAKYSNQFDSVVSDTMSSVRK
jgi:hypothetical protein